MAKQTIGIGATDNDGTGDPLRTAFDKVNDNFTELYDAAPSDTAYAASWDGVTTIPPSKNAIYDALSGTIRPAIIAGNWFVLNNDAGLLTGGLAVSANTVYYFPFLLPSATVISDLACSISTAVSAQNMALAIYGHNAATGRPTGTPLAATGDISTATGTLVSADITGADVTLQPGLYWAAYWSSGAVALTSLQAISYATMAKIVGDATLSNVINVTAGTISIVTSAETYNSSAWPDATSETFSIGVNTARIPVIMAKAA